MLELCTGHVPVCTSVPLTPPPLAQGIDSAEGGIQLITDVIHKLLHVNMSVLMGANLAKDVATEDFCEATIGGFEGTTGTAAQMHYYRSTLIVSTRKCMIAETKSINRYWTYISDAPINRIGYRC